MRTVQIVMRMPALEHVLCVSNCAPPIAVAYLLNGNGLKRIHVLGKLHQANEQMNPATAAAPKEKKKCDMEVVYRLFVCEWRMMLSLAGVPKRLIG